MKRVHPRAWVQWDFAESVSSFLSRLPAGQQFSPEQALEAVLATNRQAKIKSVSTV